MKGFQFISHFEEHKNERARNWFWRARQSFAWKVPWEDFYVAGNPATSCLKKMSLPWCEMALLLSKQIS